MNSSFFKFSPVFVLLTAELMLMTQSMAEDFTAPIPPPELGDNLTGYRTKQQILEQNIREDMDRNPPQMRVHRKDGTTVTVTDGMVPGSVGNDGSVSPGTVYTDTGDAPAKSARTVIRDKFIYSQGRMFKLYDNASLVFRIKDGGDVSWPLSRVECSNNGFRVQMNKHHDSVRILPDSRQINMANIKVYLKGRENEPLSFIVSKNDEYRPNIYEWAVVVPYKSPLNNSTSVQGITNITKSAKARTTRRIVDNQSVEAETLETDDILASGNSADNGADEHVVNPDAGIGAYPLKQKALMVIAVADDDLRSVADSLYDAVNSTDTDEKDTAGSPPETDVKDKADNSQVPDMKDPAGNFQVPEATQAK